MSFRVGVQGIYLEAGEDGSYLFSSFFFVPFPFFSVSRLMNIRILGNELRCSVVCKEACRKLKLIPIRKSVFESETRDVRMSASIPKDFSE